MLKDVYKFIEDNIDYIEQNQFDELYEEAYECLHDVATYELTKMLKTALEMNLEEVAVSVAAKHFDEILYYFVQDEHTRVSLPTFIRLYMNNLCGVSLSTFRNHIISNLPQYSEVSFDIEDGELFIRKNT